MGRQQKNSIPHYDATFFFTVCVRALLRRILNLWKHTDTRHCQCSMCMYKIQMYLILSMDASIPIIHTQYTYMRTWARTHFLSIILGLTDDPHMPLTKFC